LLHPLNQQGELFGQMDTNIDNHGESWLCTRVIHIQCSDSHVPRYTET
jgi:hypothetical protein